MPEARLIDLSPPKLRLMISLLLMQLAELAEAEARMESEASLDALLALRARAQAARELVESVKVGEVD